MRELKPGVPTYVFARLIEGVIARNTIGLSVLANAVVIRMRQEMFAQPSHLRNTPTPASPGGPPARISSALAKSFGRSEVMRKGYGAAVEVGTRAAVYPTYRSKKSASQYGYVLEVTGCRNGATYPFFYDKIAEIVEEQGEAVYHHLYGVNWTRLA